MSSIKSKNKDKNEIIVSNALKKGNNNNSDENLLNKKRTNKTQNSLSIIINKYQEEKNEGNVPISIVQNTTFKEIFTQLNINIYSDYDLELKENKTIYNLDINKKIIETLYGIIKINFNEIINLKIIYKGLLIP